MKTFLWLLFIAVLMFSCGNAGSNDNTSRELPSDNETEETHDDANNIEIDEDVEVCIDGDTSDMECGINGNGTQLHECQNGKWIPVDECIDDDECKNGDTRSVVCGLNDRGLQEQICIRGSWRDNEECNDPDECVDGKTQKVSCGEFNEGSGNETCIEGEWKIEEECLPFSCSVNMEAEERGVVAFSPDSSFLVYALNNSATIYDTETWEESQNFEVSGTVIDIDVSENNSLIAFSTTSGLFTYDRSGILQKQFSGLPIVSSSFYPPSRNAIVSIRCRDNGFEVFSYDISSGEIKHVLTDYLKTTFYNVFVEVSQNGEYLAYAFDYLKVFSSNTLSPGGSLADEIFYGLSFSTKGTKLLTAGSKPYYFLMNSDNVSQTKEIDHSHITFHDHALSSIFTQDDSTAFVIWTNGTIDVINVETANVSDSFEINTYTTPQTADFNRTLEWIAIGSPTGIEVFNISEKKGERVR